MDALQIIAVVLLFLLVLYWIGTYHFAVIKSLNIPGPKPWPFLGNIPDIWRHGNIFNLCLECKKRYGKVFHLSLGQNTSIVVADPELLKQITVKEFDKFRNRSIPVKLPHPRDTGVFFATDGDWKRIRSTLTPTFSGSKMKQMVPIIEDSCAVLMRKFHQAADTGKTVNATEFCQQYILEVLMSSIFGMETNVQTKPQKELVNSVVHFVENRSFMMDVVLPCVPFYKLIKGILQRFVLKVALSVQYPNEIAYQMINQRKKRGTDLGRKDLMQLMLTTTDSKGNRLLTDDEITAQSLTFLNAGLETTSSRLSYILYYLSKYPDLQEKLHDEVTTVVQENPDKPIYDLVQEMEYLDCFCNEVLRIINRRIGHLNRVCSESCTINGVYFPAGIIVILPYPLLHFDDDYWKEPFKFDPERFRGPAKDERPPYIFNPFGIGPRNCIAMRLAQIELKITIARLVKGLRFMLSPGAKPPSYPIKPELVELRVEQRNK